MYYSVDYQLFMVRVGIKRLSEGTENLAYSVTPILTFDFYSSIPNVRVQTQKELFFWKYYFSVLTTSSFIIFDTSQGFFLILRNR